mgnify:CR=1 FL=1
MGEESACASKHFRFDERVKNFYREYFYIPGEISFYDFCIFLTKNIEVLSHNLQATCLYKIELAKQK